MESGFKATRDGLWSICSVQGNAACQKLAESVQLFCAPRSLLILGGRRGWFWEQGGELC